MKKNAIIVSLLTLSILLSACNSNAPEEPEETPGRIPVEEPEEPASEEPAEEPVEVEKKHRYESPLQGLSPISGLPYEGDGKVIMVQMENTAKSRPHSGLSEADLIYEMEVESGITRLTTFFLGAYPEKAGPVRSARKQHIQLWSEWNYLYVFYGGSTFKPGQDIYEWIDELEITGKRVDGTRNATGYSRSTDRVAPHNAYTDLNVVLEKSYDFEPIDRTIFFDEYAEIDGDAAESISLSYRSDNQITYTYDEEKGTYLRSINGDSMMDKESGEQIALRNVIVQHAEHYHVTDTVYTNIDLIGSGEAMYFTDGNMRKGTWERKDFSSLTKYYDMDGNEIGLKPGKTFIQIMRSDAEVSYE